MSARVGVIGAGYWGRNHVRVFNQLGVLAAVCDGHDEVQAELSEKYPDAQLVPTLDQLLALELDGIVVATPASTHEEFAVRALESGHHVLVEKPCALSLKGIERIVDAATGADRTLMAGHLLLYHPALQEAKRQLEAGAIGKVHYAYGIRVNLGKVRTDESVVSSLAPHDLSMVHYLCGARAISAQATGVTAIEKPAIMPDVAFASVEYDTGLTAHFHFSWLDPFKRRELIVVGDDGMLVFDDMQKEEKLRIYHKTVVPPRAQDFGEFQQAIAVRDQGYTAVEYSLTEPLEAEARDFIAAIEDGRQPIAGAESALEVVRALELIEKSLG